MTRRIVIRASLILVILCSQIGAATASSAASVSGAPASESGQQTDSAPSAKAAPYDPDKARAASQLQDPEAATRAYLDAVSAERRELTKSYAAGNYVLEIVDFVFDSALMILLIALGLSVRFRNLAHRITRFRALQTALYWIQFFVAITIVQFPLTLYANYYREKDYGLLTQSLSGFLADRAKAIVIGCIVGSIVMMIFYGILRRAPRLWWAWLSGASIVLLILFIAV